jgi:hypothetical protein
MCSSLAGRTCARGSSPRSSLPASGRLVLERLARTARPTRRYPQLGATGRATTCAFTACPAERVTAGADSSGTRTSATGCGRRPTLTTARSRWDLVLAAAARIRVSPTRVVADQLGRISWRTTTSTSSRRISVRVANYAQYAGVQPGLNKLHLRVWTQSGPAPVSVTGALQRAAGARSPGRRSRPLRRQLVPCCWPCRRVGPVALGLRLRRRFPC